MGDSVANNYSQFYESVLKELSMIVNNENIATQDNPIFALEIKLYYIMKNPKYNPMQKDSFLKKTVVEKTQGLEHDVTSLIKKYAQVYERMYQKPLDLQYAYISILKKVKVFALETYGDRLNVIRNFYFRYVAIKNWRELLDGIILESQRRMQKSFSAQEHNEGS